MGCFDFPSGDVVLLFPFQRLDLAFGRDQILLGRFVCTVLDIGFAAVSINEGIDAALFNSVW
jgi:hypothetical protein